MQLIYHDYYSGCTSSETCSFGATSACLYGSPIQLFSCTARIFVQLTVHHLEKLSQTINLMTAAIPPSCWEVVESVAGMDWRWSKKTNYIEECEEFHYVPLYWMSPCLYLTYILSISVQSQHMFELAVVTMIPYSLILNAVSA